jgi:hypothetical protein
MTCIPPDDSIEPIEIDDGNQIDQNKKSEFFIFIFAPSTQCDHPAPLPMMTIINKPPHLLYVL